MKWFGSNKKTDEHKDAEPALVSGRRKAGRRTEQRRETERGEEDQRGTDRRETQRREIFRVIYPPNSAPKVLNNNFNIIDISAKAVKFTCNNKEDMETLHNETPVELKIEFNDGEILEVKGKIMNSYHDDSVPEQKYFVCYFEKEIPPARVSKEQAYLLKHFPDFCRNQR